MRREREERGETVKKDFLITPVGKTTWSGLAAGQDLTSFRCLWRGGGGGGGGGAEVILLV